MIEVDLIDSDGGIASVAAAEENFWNASSSQAAAWAAQYGYTLDVKATPPAPGTYERNLYQWGDYQNWLASQNASAVRSPTAGSSTTEVVAGVAVVGIVLGVFWWLLK